MDAERVELTPEQRQYILGLLRSGTFPRVAVETAGIPWADFRRWRVEETRRGNGEQVRAFRAAMRQAAAQARAKAELEVREKTPLLWLKHGPGRERRGNPGWTNPAKPGVGKHKENSPAWLEAPRAQALFGQLLDGLGQFPQAHLAFAAILDRAGDEATTPAGEPHSKSSSAETPVAGPPGDASPTRR